MSLQELRLRDEMKNRLAALEKEATELREKAVADKEIEIRELLTKSNEKKEAELENFYRKAMKSTERQLKKSMAESVASKEVEIRELLGEEYKTKQAGLLEDLEKTHLEELSKERAHFEPTLQKKEKHWRAESTAKIELWVCIFYVVDCESLLIRMSE